MTNERPLHERQAESLRWLADAIEETPALADVLDIPLRYISTTFREDARAKLAAFRDAMEVAGAEVSVDNAATACTVDASLGAVRLKVWASADAMKGIVPVPKYAPLVSGKDGSK